MSFTKSMIFPNIEVISLTVFYNSIL